MSTIIGACPICAGAMDLAMSDTVAFVIHIQNCHTASLMKATLDERERCAKIADKHKMQYAGHRDCCGPADAAQGIANEIREVSF